MAVWYHNFGNGSSTGYYAVAQWAASTAYTVGQIVRQLATPAVNSERCFRCTTAGTSGASEPTWVLTKAGATVDNTAHWTECTGNSAYGWTAPHARAAAAAAWMAAGDDLYTANTSAETQATANTITFPGTSTSGNRWISVDTTNTPPTGSDVLAGASVTTTGASTITLVGQNLYVYGLTFNAGTGTGNANFNVELVNGTGNPITPTLEACDINLLTTSATAVIQFTAVSYAEGNRVELINTTVTFSAAGQTITAPNGDFIWRDTLSAVSGTRPTALLTKTAQAGTALFLGVDLSFLTSGAIIGTNAYSTPYNVLFLNCQLGSGATFSVGSQDRIDLVNSDSAATSYRQERHQYTGALVASTTVYNAASDGVTPISWAITPNTNNSRWQPFECFEIVEWAAPGTYANTVIQVCSTTTGLTNADVWVEARVMASASFPITSMYSSAPANMLTTPTSLAAGVTWAAPLSGGTYYELQVPSFTVAMAGYVRFMVKVGRTSGTIYVDPSVTIA